jgi:hypothetical protein
LLQGFTDGRRWTSSRSRIPLVHVSHLAIHIEGHLAELDMNPLMVLPSGQRVKAVDALVVLRLRSIAASRCLGTRIPYRPSSLLFGI